MPATRLATLEDENMKPPTILLITFLICSTILAAQTRKATEKSAPATQQNAQAKFKAIWEPVNYKEDLSLTDVFFVSEQEGWVTGEHGTILHTKDGGDTWTPQLGGDPQSAEPPIQIFDSWMEPMAGRIKAPEGTTSCSVRSTEKTGNRSVSSEGTSAIGLIISLRPGMWEFRFVRNQMTSLKPWILARHGSRFCPSVQQRWRSRD